MHNNKKRLKPENCGLVVLWVPPRSGPSSAKQQHREEEEDNRNHNSTTPQSRQLPSYWWSLRCICESHYGDGLGYEY